MGLEVAVRGVHAGDIADRLVGRRIGRNDAVGDTVAVDVVVGAIAVVQVGPDLDLVSGHARVKADGHAIRRAGHLVGKEFRRAVVPVQRTRRAGHSHRHGRDGDRAGDRDRLAARAGARHRHVAGVGTRRGVRFEADVDRRAGHRAGGRREGERGRVTASDRRGHFEPGRRGHAHVGGEIRAGYRKLARGGSDTVVGAHGRRRSGNRHARTRRSSSGRCVCSGGVVAPVFGIEPVVVGRAGVQVGVGVAGLAAAVDDSVTTQRVARGVGRSRRRCGEVGVGAAHDERVLVITRDTAGPAEVDRRRARVAGRDAGRIVQRADFDAQRRIGRRGQTEVGPTGTRAVEPVVVARTPRHADRPVEGASVGQARGIDRELIKFGADPVGIALRSSRGQVRVAEATEDRAEGPRRAIESLPRVDAERDRVAQECGRCIGRVGILTAGHGQGREVGLRAVADAGRVAGEGAVVVGRTGGQVGRAVGEDTRPEVAARGSLCSRARGESAVRAVFDAAH